MSHPIRCTLVLFLITSATHAADRPNILIAISDDQSWPHVSAGGCEWVQTPGFDRVAGAGVLFRNAYAPTPGCSPTRASLLTGRHAWQIREAGTHASSFPSEFKTFPDLLERVGYVVGYTGKAWGPGNWRTSGRTRNPAGPNFSKRKHDSTPPGVSKTDYAANFQDFLAARDSAQPFCFWFGGHEPHRGFHGKRKYTPDQLRRVTVPAFLPDLPEVRADLLDYGAEVEWFDSHLVRMIKTLEDCGELENTLIIVTSDNGMAFPRAKANLYEFGVHMPLAVAWPDEVPGGRTVDDLVGFVDVTATILEAGRAGSAASTLPGSSLLSVLRSTDEGVVEPGRDAVYAARERHSSSRYHSLGYPQRCVRARVGEREMLYIRNFRPERWPAGAPQKFGRGGYPSPAEIARRRLGPEHGGYHDIDGCPTLSLLVARRDDPQISPFLALAVDRRPAEELFDVAADPACVNNLADDLEWEPIRVELEKRLMDYLRETNDPRVLDGGDVFETYPRYSGIRVFPEPEWARDRPDRVPDQPWLQDRIRQLERRGAEGGRKQ